MSVSSTIIDTASGRREGGKINFVYWSLQILCWSFYFYLQASGEVIFADVPWRKAVMLWSGVSLTAITLTQTLRWVFKRYAWLTLPPRALLARVAASVLVISLASWLITIALSLVLHGTPIAPIFGVFYHKLPLGTQFFNEFLASLSLDGTWVAIYLSVVMQRRRYHAELRQAQLAEALQTAELLLLKTQLNPHFLFNALNSVRALIAGEPDRAQDAVTQLARILRYTLSSDNDDFVTLAREFEMVDDYLALESLRLAERLNVVRDIELAALTTRIPVMLVQTLVENAIKHGIAPLKQGGTLRMSARVVAEELVIRVSNPYQDGGISAATEGVGLKNLSERLRLLFGSAGRLHLDLSHPSEAIAMVWIPT